MMTFLQQEVMPTAHDNTIVVLRRVLFDEPFKIRSPQELVAAARRLGDSVITLVNAALVKLGMAQVDDAGKREYFAFVETRCDDGDSGDEEASLPSSILDCATDDGVDELMPPRKVPRSC